MADANRELARAERVVHACLTVPDHNRHRGESVSAATSMQRFKHRRPRPVLRIFTPACQSRIDLSAAVVELEKASRLLSAAVSSGVDEMIDARFSNARTAWEKAAGAIASYKDHFAEA